jgi:hypothetical protein
VFWDGHDPNPTGLVDQWKTLVGFREGDTEDDWGYVKQAGNGTSGRPVRERVLGPLGIAVDATWFTDCVNTYFVKTGTRSQGAAWGTRFAPFAAAAGLPGPSIPRRPTVSGLVEAAVTDHAQRLRGELDESNSPLVVTLGEEARQVLAAIADDSAGPPTQPLTRDTTRNYGQPGTITMFGQQRNWIALVHPGQRDTQWRAIHDT